MMRFYIACLFLGLTLTASAQAKFLEEVFDGVTVTPNQIYGVNATILAFPVAGQAIPQPLIMDVYEPAGDTSSLRPLVIFWHTGNFLPHPQNGNIGGSLRDSAAVEICRRLARHGFVAASADYRLGWNPVAPSKDERVLTLINAAYRGVQDANTCVRYWKKTVAEFGNPWRIDTSRIVHYGEGTGGYVGLNVGALDDYFKIPTASNGKFLLSDGMGNFVPMVLEGVNGDIEAKEYGINPGIPFLPFPVGDTLCYANHVNYSSDYAVGVNLGGAIGDSAWVDPGQPPVISVHTPYDPFAPYKEGLVLVPIDPPLEVVEVQGSYLVSYLANLYGNNLPLDPTNVTDFQYEVTDVANAQNDGLEGLYPMYGTGGPFDSAPWQFWDPATNVNSATGFMTNPDMTREKAMNFIDSVFAYVQPRLYSALDLYELTSTKEIVSNDEIQMLAYPNPTMEEVFIAVDKEYPIRSIGVYDLSGKQVAFISGINHNYYTLKVGHYQPGQYVLQFQFDQGIAARQITVQ
jgi:hypothetical protein